MFRKIINKILGNPNVKNGILFSVFSFFNNGVSFLLLIVLAKYISPSAYGELNLFNTLVYLFGILISLNSVGVLSVNYFSSSRAEFRQSFNSVLLITLVTFCILLFILIYFSHVLVIYTGLDTKYQIIALVICLFNVVLNLNLDLWRLEEKILKYGIFSVLMSLCNCILTLFFVISISLDWQGRLYAQLVTCILFSSVSIVFLIKGNYLTFTVPSAKRIKDTLSFGIPLIPHGLSFWARQGLDRYIINYAYSQAIVGMFSFSFNFANVIQIVGTAFNASNSVFLFRSLSSDSETTRKMLRKQERLMLLFILGLSVCICGGCAIFIPIVLPQYSDSIVFLFPLCFGAMFQCYYLLYVNYLFFYRRTKQLMYITLSISVLHVILSVWLTKYSILLTAYINLLTNFLIAIFVYFYHRKFCRLNK